MKNKVYFHGFTNEARTDVIDFSDSQLVRVAHGSSNDEILTSGIKTEHRGKGFVEFEYTSGYDFYLDVNLGSKNGVVRKQINPKSFLMIPDFAYEITFTI